MIHVDGSVDPLRDIETINLELIFSDIEVIDRRIAKMGKGAASNKSLAKELNILKAVKEHLENGNLAKSFECEDDEEQAFVASLDLLTWKPVIFAANVGEDDLPIRMYRLSASSLLRTTAKCLLCARRSRRRSPS